MGKAAGKVPRGRLEDGAPNPIDSHVGGRVRLRRTLMGMTQEQLGEAIGLTFQQVQKYERGANRMGASRLFDVARVLDVPVSFFFDDLDDATKAASPAAIIKGEAFQAEAPSSLDPDPMCRRETLELVRAYYNISDPQIRRRVYELAKALGASEA
ncbi:MAG: helix-turn-helix transcriptional regulator [Magnetospirillum sp.]|nr:helix-turn-helix transcriptional regulator [Magnetospirillum sp.]